MERHFLKSIFLSCLVIILWGSCGAHRATGMEVRPPAVAGTFYPGSADQLRRAVTALLNRAPRVIPEGEIMAAIAPHAGYVFSGRVAAYTYKALSFIDFDTIVIIGHDSYREAVAFTCPVDYFRTPLGKVPVDREMIAKMEEFNPGIRPNRILHAREHTIEVQLPFLQVLGKNCKIVPLLFGNPTVENCRILSNAILKCAGTKRVFVLASTDMSHYPPYQWAKKIDKATLEALRSLDIDLLFSHLTEQEQKGFIPNLRTAMCARGGVGTAILFAKARGAVHAQVLHYANSGDTPGGQKDRVVGYGAALMVK